MFTTFGPRSVYAQQGARRAAPQTMQTDDVELEIPLPARIDTSSVQDCQLSFVCCREEKYELRGLIGFRVRPAAPCIRYKPYELPARREERHRTKSENNDVVDAIAVPTVSLDVAAADSDSVAQLKKAKSLESIILENNKEVDLKGYFKMPEVEAVSDCIGKLKVDE